MFFFFQDKLLFTVCFTLSQTKDIFSYLKTTVYSCYSCSRQEGALFFSSSQLSTQANIRFPLKYTVSLVSVFLVDYPKMFFLRQNYCLQYVSLCHSLKTFFLIWKLLSTLVTVVADKKGLNFFFVSVVYID